MYSFGRVMLLLFSKKRLEQHLGQQLKTLNFAGTTNEAKARLT